MFKELILAIIFGGLIGFGATGTFIALHKKNPPMTATTTTTSQIDNPLPTEPNSNTPAPSLAPTHNSLNIFEPQNESVVSDSKVTLKGQTDASAAIIITTIDSSYSINADSSGNFDITINVNPGLNQLKISSISPSDVENNTELFITYTTAKI